MSAFGDRQTSQFKGVMSACDPKRTCSGAALGAKRSKDVTQWLAGDHHEAGEWLAQLEDQENRCRRGKRKNAQSDNRGCVVVGEQAEARKYDGEPRYQDHKEGNGDCHSRLGEQEQTYFCQILGGIYGSGLQGALCVVARRQFQNLIVKG